MNIVVKRQFRQMVGLNVKVGLATNPTSWVVGVLHSIDEYGLDTVVRVDGLEKTKIDGQERDLATQTCFSLDDVLVWRTEHALPLT